MAFGSVGLKGQKLVVVEKWTVYCFSSPSWAPSQCLVTVLLQLTKFWDWRDSYLSPFCSICVMLV